MCGFEQVNAVEEALIYGVQDLDSLVTIQQITDITPPLKPLKMPAIIELTEFHFDARPR